jgi:acyl-CoA synthetase (NDP forming)
VIGGFDRDSDADATLAPFRRRWGDRFVLVDPDGGALGGLTIWRSVAEVPGSVDVAIVNVSAEDVVQIVGECGSAGVRFAVVSTSGLAEVGPDGAAVEAELVSVARRHGLRMLGPNANANCFDAIPSLLGSEIARIGLITQSGHMGRVISQSAAHGVAFSRWIPTGNEADLGTADFIEYFAEDEETGVVAGYFEGFRDIPRLRSALRVANERRVPIVLIKVGRHRAATQMAASHTAHLTGSDAVMDGFFRQHAVTRVDDVDELIEVAALHAKLRPPPRGRRVGLYGISGGALALMADHAEAAGIEVPTLREETQRRLHEILPEHLGVANPVDNGNLYRTGSLEQRRAIFDLVGSDPQVDLLVCALTGFLPGITDDYVGDILAFRSKADKPVVVTWNTWEMGSDPYRELVASGIPIFRSFRGCFQALAGFFDYLDRVERAAGRPLDSSSGESAGATRVAESAEAAALLRRHGVPLVESRSARSLEEARAAVAELGFPVVLKVELPEYPHKSDVGLVRVGIRTDAELGRAFDALVARAGELETAVGQPSVLVQPQIGEGVEMIVGIAPDEVFGCALLVGFGGVGAEIIRDVSVRPLPVTRDDVHEMLRELRGYPILEGFRGSSPCDVDALVRLVLAVCDVAADPAAGVVELDLNPVFASAEGAVAADQLLVLEAR